MRFGARAVRGVALGSAVAANLVLACSSKDESTPSGTGGSSVAGLGPGGSAGAAAGNAGRGNGAGRGGAAGSNGSNAGTAGRAGGSGRGPSAAGAATAGRGGAALGGEGGREPRGSAGAAGSGEEPIACNDQCHYVRADADGAGDGTSWTDAFAALPASLERGHVYFIASGSYAAHDFDDAPAGGASIAILRATADDHGDSDGWDDAYGAGDAVFGELDFRQPSYDFDGRNAVRVVGSYQGTVVRIGADAVRFRGVDVDGTFATSSGMHSAGACTGMEISGDDVIVQGNRVHGIADDGVVVGGSTNLLFEGNEIDSLFGCGTDGGCGPCDNGHSDGLEIYAVHDSRFVGNFAHDIQSTSTFFFGNWADELGDGPDDYCENILLANNVLYNPDTGFVVYLEDVRSVRLIGNTIWGKHAGRYGGLAIGVNVTGLELFDNAILSVNFQHLGSTFDPAEHHGDYNLFGISLGQWTDASHDIVALDPGFTAIPDADGDKVENPKPADFTPTAASPLEGAGSSDVDGLSATDFFGTARSTPPTIGAIE